MTSYHNSHVEILPEGKTLYHFHINAKGGAAESIHTIIIIVLITLEIEVLTLSLNSKFITNSNDKQCKVILARGSLMMSLETCMGMWLLE